MSVPPFPYHGLLYTIILGPKILPDTARPTKDVDGSQEALEDRI